jgi:glycosyltransferase involved in cell wall biosynthesis
MDDVLTQSPDAPVLTIVVLAWNVAAYVRKAIESCFQLPEGALEVVVIENASSDHTRQEIAAAVAGRRNVRVVENATNIGAGLSRNQGMALARGKYLAFLDGDDWFVAGALPKILAKAVAEDADVVVFDHARLTIAGEMTEGRNRRHLRRALQGGDTARFHAAMTSQAAWNKLYRRSFLAEHSFRFADSSHYEDIDWSYRIHMTAPRLVAITDIGVVYRQRAGSTLHARSTRHLDVVEHVRNLIEFIMARPHHVAAGWAHFIAGRMLRQFTAILGAQHRLDWDDRKRLAGAARRVFLVLDPHNRLVAETVRGRVAYHLLRAGLAAPAAAYCAWAMPRDMQ